MRNRTPCLVAIVATGAISQSANAIESFWSFLDVGQVLGADAFYANGFAGGNTVVASIEGGLAWNGHATLGHVTNFFSAPSTTGIVSSHATSVASLVAGRGTTVEQRGIAHQSTFWSGSLASTLTSGTSWSTGTSDFWRPYETVIKTGVSGRRADVVTSSWGARFNNGNGTFSYYAGNYEASKVTDMLAARYGTTLCFAAMNDGPGQNTVRDPGAAYNSITVGALWGVEGSDFNQVADFSGRGAVATYVPTSQSSGNIIAPAQSKRAAVDLVAPGGDLWTATSAGANSYGYFDGTSAATPLVAAGAALLTDVAYARYGGGNAKDGRVIKAVLMNSARKIPGWSNGMYEAYSPPVTNGNPLFPIVIFPGFYYQRTDQALDFSSGAGAMDLRAAYAQFAGSAITADVAGLGGGSVEAAGWDYGVIAQNGLNKYDLPAMRAGETLTVTLNWFAEYTEASGGFANWGSLDDLSLSIVQWGGSFVPSLALSDSQYNNVEHLVWTAPYDGYFSILVKWQGEVWDLTGDANQTAYGLAWSIPAPGAALLLGLGGILAARRRRANS